MRAYGGPGAGSLVVYDSTGGTSINLQGDTGTSAGSLTVYDSTSGTSINLQGDTGTITAAAYSLSPPQTRVLQISANGFVPDNPSEGYDRGVGLISPSGDTSLQFFANVNLPDGATVTKLVGVFYDAGTENFTDIDMRMRYFSTSSLTAVTMAEFFDQNTVGQAGGRVEFADSTISNAVINNTDRAYTVDINFNVDSATSNTRFYGVRIEYTINSLAP